MRRERESIESIVQRTLGDVERVRARNLDLVSMQREAAELRDKPFENLSKLIDSALHRKTREYLIVTDIDADARKLRRFLRRHFLSYRALRRRLLRDPYTRDELKRSGSGLFGRVTSIDVFRFIARRAGGAATISLHGRAAVFLLPGFHDPDAARASLERSAAEFPVLAKLGDFSEPHRLSFAIRLHTRHEAAHSEDGMGRLAGVRNRYLVEPESDASMVMHARREALLLEEEVTVTLDCVARLREVAGGNYYFCNRAIRHALEVDDQILLRMDPREIARLGDQIAESVVPPFEVLQFVENALAEMWRLTQSQSINYTADDPRHERMAELLRHPDVEAWLEQTIGAFREFGLCFEEHRERVLHYADQFYRGVHPRI